MRNALKVLMAFVFQFHNAQRFNENILKKWYDSKDAFLAFNKNTKYESFELIKHFSNTLENGDYVLNLKKINDSALFDEDFLKKIEAKK